MDLNSPTLCPASSSLNKGMAFWKNGSTYCKVVSRHSLKSFVHLPFMPQTQTAQTTAGCVITCHNSETVSPNDRIRKAALVGETHVTQFSCLWMRLVARLTSQRGPRPQCHRTSLSPRLELKCCGEHRLTQSKKHPVLAPDNALT